MAVDWISEKLVDRGVSVLRIGNPSRVNDKMLSFTYERRFESHPDYPQLWSIRKAIRELYTRSRKGNDRESIRQKINSLKDRATELEIRINESLFSEARVIACTLVGSANRLLTGQKFGTVFIDEAAQALEAACWIPLRKADRAILAGDHCQLPPTVKSSEQRRRFIETFRDNPRIDTADTRSGHSAQETGTAKQITLYAHLDSKFIMTFEGNDIASNIRWVMSTNSIAVMPRPRNESWFMEGRLRPGYHYIEVRDDYSDLEEKIDYYIAHPEQAQQIIDHANDFARQFYDSRRERFISLLVMKKYFEKTGQLPPTNR